LKLPRSGACYFKNQQSSIDHRQSLGLGKLDQAAPTHEIPVQSASQEMSFGDPDDLLASIVLVSKSERSLGGQFFGLSKPGHYLIHRVIFR
jgi:hypothetical protein